MFKETKQKIIFKYFLGVFFIIIAGYIFFQIGDSNNLIQTKKIIDKQEILAITTESEKQILIATTTKVEKKNSTTKTTAVNTKVECDISNTDFDCYQKYYTYLVREEGVANAFLTLKKQYEVSGYVRSQCHPLTHVIGRIAANTYTKAFEAYKYGDPLCWSGYYHGVMEEIVNKLGIEKIKDELDNVCMGIKGKENYSFDYYNCVHGLGHGLMAITENELFDSLKYCDNLSGGWEKSSCYGGVFMENVIVDNKNHFTKYLKPSEPLYPCNAVDISYKTQCYLMQTSYMLKVTNHDFNKVFELCRQADTGFEAICFQSLGRDASGQSLSNAENTWAKCNLGLDYNEKSNCLIGSVKDFISYYHGDKEANVLCSIVSSDLQSICLNTATSYYKSL